MQEKESIMVLRCKLKIPILGNCSASLGKPRNAEPLPSLQLLKILIVVNS